MRKSEIRAILDDITGQSVDAVVNAASPQMRGGGGVDGAIHKAAGSQLMAQCIERFPHGLQTGDAGWTEGFELHAKYVIHTPGPNYSAGQTDPGLLRSSYRRCMEVATELGVESIAFPLISAGIYGWPLENAIQVAVDTIRSEATQQACTVEDVRLVVLNPEYRDKIDAEISQAR